MKQPQVCTPWPLVCIVKTQRDSRMLLWAAFCCRTVAVSKLQHKEQHICRFYIFGVFLPAVLTHWGACCSCMGGCSCLPAVWTGRTPVPTGSGAGVSKHHSSLLKNWVWVEKSCACGKGNRRIVTLLRSHGIGHRVSWILMQSIVHSMHNLLKAFLVLAGWKGWRAEGWKGGDQSQGAQQAELASCQQLQGHTDLPKMGSNFKVHQCTLNRKSACWSSLSVRACRDTAVPSPHSQRAGGHKLHLLSHKECFWLRKTLTAKVPHLRQPHLSLQCKSWISREGPRS